MDDSFEIAVAPDSISSPALIDCINAPMIAEDAPWAGFETKASRRRLLAKEAAFP
jgi:hypothetical protein